MDGSDEFLVPSADIDRAWPGDRPYESLYLSCWLASIDLDLNLDLLNRVRMAPKKSRFFFLLRPRSAVTKIKHEYSVRLIIVWPVFRKSGFSDGLKLVSMIRISDYQRLKPTCVDCIY